MKQSPWKNGGGVTSEIAIHPQDAQLAKLDFVWRLSIATVSSNGPFSRFPGYDRLLVVWKGAGFVLNGEQRKRLEPFRFTGEDEINASLISGEVKDFGVIFKRDAVHAAMETRALRENEVSVVTVENLDSANSSSLLTSKSSGTTGRVSFASTNFILCAEGALRVGEFYLNPGEVVRADFEEGAHSLRESENENGQLKITALADSKFVIVRLRNNS